MSKKLIARTAKLHSEPGRMSRRFKGIAITYEHIPKDLEERNHGSIYAVINVNTTNPEAEDVAELIIDTFLGEFYQNLHEPALASFEAALAKINEELAEITQQGHINWLNNLNAVLAVLSGNVLHITQSGKAEAYLYRGEKSSHISDDLAGDAINPLRTFINIASGELHESDKVAIVTPSVFFHISKDELKRYVQEFQPKVAISHIADLLEGTSSEMNPNAVLIIETVTPEVAANETLVEQPDEVWISEKAKPVETAVDTAAPFVKKVFQVVAVGWSATSGFVSGKVLPFLKEKGSQTGELYKTWKKEKNLVKDEPVLVKTSESLSSSLDKDQEIDNVEEKGAIITAPKLKTKNEIYIKEDHVTPKWLKLEKVDFSHVKNLGQKFGSYTEKYTKNKRNMLIAGMALLVVLALGIFITWQKRIDTENTKTANAAMNEAESKLEIGENGISQNRTLAIASLTSAKKIAENYKNNKTVKDRANALMTQINSALDQAENISRVNTEQVADASNIVGNNTFGPFVADGNLFLIGKDNGKIASINLTSKEVSKVLDSSSVGKVVGATLVESRKVIVLATETDLYEFDTKEKKLTKQNLDETLEKPVAISSYLTNIYILTSDGNIYKHAKTSGGYAKKVTYITDNNYASNPIDIRIDSNIFVLSKDGVVIKYLSGKKQVFSVTDLPQALENPKGFFVDENTTGLYLVNGNDRIVRTDSKGKFTNQYAADSLQNLSGLSVNETTKTVYTSSNGKVLKFSY